VRGANNESSEVCGIIKPGQTVKLSRSETVNVHKLLTIRYLREGRHRLPVNYQGKLCVRVKPEYEGNRTVWWAVQNRDKDGEKRSGAK